MESKALLSFDRTSRKVKCWKDSDRNICLSKRTSFRPFFIFQKSKITFIYSQTLCSYPTCWGVNKMWFHFLTFFLVIIWIPHQSLRFWNFENLRFWDFENLRSWDFAILRIWNFEILRFWDFEILRFLNFEILTNLKLQRVACAVCSHASYKP